MTRNVSLLDTHTQQEIAVLLTVKTVSSFHNILFQTGIKEFLFLSLTAILIELKVTRLESSC